MRKIIYLVSIAICVVLILALMPTKSKASGTDYEVVCIQGFEFISATRSGTYTQIFSDGGYVAKCTMP